MKQNDLFQVDAFAERPFTGNPAAVCILPAGDDQPEHRWMQLLAAEMNLSETAFLQQRLDGDYSLRWFTPAAEVDLCGHATLASAHVLWEQELLAPQKEARFHTRSGLLKARRGGDGKVEMEFPAIEPQACPAPEGLEQALGAKARWTGTGLEDLVVELADAEALRSLRPDLSAVAALAHPASAEHGPPQTLRGVSVTAAAEPDSSYDFVSRFFAPGIGVDEDPVTGSAHCRLGPYWGRRLGKQRMMAYQASPRGGEVEVTLLGERVLLAGRAHTVFEGRLCAP